MMALSYQKQIDIWNYISGDVYELDTLYEIQKFFLDDLASAQRELYRVKSFAKYGLPGFRFMLIHTEAEVEESFANLAIVETAIAEAKERLEV